MAVIIGLILVMLIGIGGLALVRTARRAAARDTQRQAQATPAIATILQVGRSLPHRQQLTVNVRLRLRIPGENQASLEVTTVWDVDVAHLVTLQQGATIPVTCDRDDPRRIYPRVPWATFSPLYHRPTKQN